MPVAEVVSGAVGVLGRTDDRCLDSPLGNIEFTNLGIERQAREPGPFIPRRGELNGERFHVFKLSNTCSLHNP